MYSNKELRQHLQLGYSLILSYRVALPPALFHLIEAVTATTLDIKAQHTVVR